MLIAHKSLCTWLKNRTPGFLSPPCWRPDRVKQYPPVQQHWLDAGYESVVDEPQLSYYLVHVGNPTENCFFRFTFETQQKTASSGSRWKPNRKLLLPVHFWNPTENCFFQFTLETQQKTASSSSPWKPNRKLFPVRLRNPTENCFQFSLEIQQKTVSWPLIIHPSWYTGGVRERERERERKDEKAMARVRPLYCCKLRVRCKQDGNRAPCSSSTTGRWSAFEMKAGMCFLSSLSLSLHLFSPLVHVDDLLLSFCFVTWTVTCRRSSLQWSNGEVCVYARGARGLVLVPFWCRFLSFGEKFFQPICRRLDNKWFCTTILHGFVGLQILVPSFSFCRCHWYLGFLSLDQDLALFVAMRNKKQARRQLE